MIRLGALILLVVASASAEGVFRSLRLSSPIKGHAYSAEVHHAAPAAVVAGPAVSKGYAYSSEVHHSAAVAPALLAAPAVAVKGHAYSSEV
ncbi:hypothetical protein AVEN_45998-1, partial [Araneus ventricosus]